MISLMRVKILSEYKNEYYIKSILKSHKVIRNSIISRISQITERLRDIDESVIYSTSIPGIDYSKTSVSNSDISDSTSVAALEIIKRKEKLYSELAVCRSELDEMEKVFDIYRSLQTHMPIHFEVCNDIYIRNLTYETVKINYRKGKDTVIKMSENVISIICKLFNLGYNSEQITFMSSNEFADLIGTELFEKINKIEANEKSN